MKTDKDQDLQEFLRENHYNDRYLFEDPAFRSIVLKTLNFQAYHALKCLERFWINLVTSLKQ